ncbi:PaaI family thioesterase [Ruegeria profundi]|uniref:PaaI family thioesterase n=1 Tax=Ruegeria profundi TaxID=1685378 RepID=UPI001CD6898B|nr:PaaI family thioesterase [Ruegeria profundi]MCA0928407.1 PaaI family thioesterase [Ruegeria profundi]
MNTDDESAAQSFVGYESSVFGQGSGICALNIGPQHLNRVNVLHGGFVAMLLDNGCGLAVRNDSGDPDRAVLTMSLSVNYIAPARSGRVVATGNVTGGGKSTKFASAELRTEDGTLLATASGVFKLLRE